MSIYKRLNRPASIHNVFIVYDLTGECPKLAAPTLVFCSLSLCLLLIVHYQPVKQHVADSISFYLEYKQLEL